MSKKAAVMISGAGVLSVRSSEVVKTERGQDQLKALKKIHERLSRQPKSKKPASAS